MKNFKFLVSICAIGVAAAGHAITIAEAKALGDGADVSLDAAVIVNTIDTVASGSVASFHIQDATGGITVFGSTADIAGILTGLGEGDTVNLSGTNDIFNGLFELTSPVLDSSSAGPGLPAATAVTTADFQDGSATAEGLESMLVNLMNVSFVDAGGTFSGSSNYMVTDGINSATVRIATGDIDLVGTTIPTGNYNLTGILSQFDNSDPRDGGYQLLLNSADDIAPVPEPATMTLAALGLGALAARRKRKA